MPANSGDTEHRAEVTEFLVFPGAQDELGLVVRRRNHSRDSDDMRVPTPRNPISKET
jgi:hypothetical protein